MESKDAEGAIDVFAMVLFTIASLAVGYAGIEGVAAGYDRAWFPFMAGALGAGYFGQQAVRTFHSLLLARKRPDSPEEYGDNGTTTPHP